MASDLRPFSDFFAEPTRNGLTRPKSVRGAGVKMVNMGELFAHDRIREIPMDRVPLSEAEKNSLLRSGDLLFARQSLVLAGAGKCAIFLGDKDPVTFESHVIRVRLEGSKSDPLFFFYFFRSPEGRATIESIVEQGAGASGIRASDLSRLLVPDVLPGKQRAIAHILGSLDDKIDLNRRMNETLEALARAIFDDMFGDATPNAVVGDLVDIERDSVSPMEHEDELFDHYSLPAFDESRRPVRERGGNIKSNKFIVNPGAVLLSKLNPAIPRVWYPRVRREPRSIASTEFQVMRSRETSSPEFLYCLLRSEVVREHLVGLASGTSNSHQRVKPDDLLATPAPRPNANGLDSFTRAVSPMLERVNANLEESRILAALRDTLLPKLLSGEVRVPDAEKSVGGEILDANP